MPICLTEGLVQLEKRSCEDCICVCRFCGPLFLVTSVKILGVFESHAVCTSWFICLAYFQVTFCLNSYTSLPTSAKHKSISIKNADEDRWIELHIMPCVSSLFEINLRHLKEHFCFNGSNVFYFKWSKWKSWRRGISLVSFSAPFTERFLSSAGLLLSALWWVIIPVSYHFRKCFLHRHGDVMQH